MHGLNYAGATFNRDFIDVVEDLLNKGGWVEEPPFHIDVGTAGKTTPSVVSKSIDSTEFSKFIYLLVSNNIPHRLFNIPYYKARVMESFTDNGRGLVIHYRPRDIIHQMDFVIWSDRPKLSDDTTIKSILVVGPNNEARKVYRWLDFWFREHNVFMGQGWSGMYERLKHCKVYINDSVGNWSVYQADGCYFGEVTGDLSNECFMAKVNGYSQHGVIIDSFD